MVVDRDKDGTVTTADGDLILEAHEALSPGATLRGDNNPIRFTSRGTARDSGTLLMCDSRGPTKAGGIVVSPSGRSRAAADSDNNGKVEDGSGNELTTCPW